MNRLKRLAATLALLAPPLALPLVVPASARAGDVEDGQALQQAGKFDEALAKFQAAVKADPTDGAAALGLSQVLAGLGRYDEAARAVDPARKAHPENVALVVAKGRAYLLAAMNGAAAAEPDQGQVDSYQADAEKWANQALKTDPKNSDALVLRGQLHQRVGSDDQAKMFFEQAASADPKSFDAAYELARYWFTQAGKDNKNLDLWTRAEEAFLGALRIDPKSPMALVNVAHCKAWRRAPAKDVSLAYLRALEASPKDEAILKNAYKWTPVEERVAVMQKLAEAMPHDVTRKLYLAYAMATPQAKQYEKARDVLEAASRIDPKSPYVPLCEGDVTMAWGKTDEAIDFYVEAMTLFAGKIDDATYGKLAGTIAFQGKSLTVEQREKLWTALWKLFPTRYDAMNNAGLFFRDIAKDYEKSLEWYLRAAKVAPDDVCIQNDTGLIYHYHMKDFDKAEPYYRKAVEIGKAKGYDCNAGNDPDRGFRDAVNNLHLILAAQKRWHDLRKFAEEDVPESHPLRDAWIKDAADKEKK